MFSDSCKRSLKCVLHNGNVYGAIPVGYSTVMKEQHDDIKIVVDLLNYHEHKWIICVDLVVVVVVVVVVAVVDVSYKLK